MIFMKFLGYTNEQVSSNDYDNVLISSGAPFEAEDLKVSVPAGRHGGGHAGSAKFLDEARLDPPEIVRPQDQEGRLLCPEILEKFFPRDLSVGGDATKDIGAGPAGQVQDAAVTLEIKPAGEIGGDHTRRIRGFRGQGLSQGGRLLPGQAE